MDILSQIKESLFGLTKRAIELNLAPKVILDNGLIAGMDQLRPL